MGLLGAVVMIVVVLFATGIVQITTRHTLVAPETCPTWELIEAGASIAEIEGAILQNPDDASFANISMTVLDVAVENDRVDAVSLLLNHGADPNGNLNDMVFSPLTRAVKQQNAEIVKQLLDAGADPHGKPRIISPYEVAMDEGNAQIIELFKQSTKPKQTQ